MKEIGVATTNGIDNKCEIEYDFETGILFNKTYNHKKKMDKIEYARVKNNTIKSFKNNGYKLSFTIV